DASPKSSDSIYNEINAPHYRDFLNDVTFGEGDSWFDKQNNTTILSFLEKKFDVLTLANDSKLSTDLKDDIDIAYKQETVSKESNIQKHLDPPQRVRNYPTLRSLGIQKRQPMKKFIPELTVPKPFKFHTITRINKTERTESQLLKSPYIPLAARIKQFMERTPDRFKSNLVSIKPTAIQVNLPTKPKSPILRTKLRAKSRKVLETEKKKTKENHIIHKKSVNLKRFEFGVPRIKKADITIPRSPPITKPKPPVRKSPSPPHIIKVNPIPDFKEPFRPIIPRRKLKMPKFSLPGDEISHRKAKEKEEKIRRETLEQEKARLFKAQPLPSDSPDV
ncbi:10350_t:CDS:2, partial [Scutellospora calospora]